MKHKRIGLLAVVTVALASPSLRADEPERTPWNYAPVSPVCQTTPCRERFTPPLFGDQFQFGFNFNGGFQFQGGFNFNFGGGGFNLNGGGFNLNFGGGGFNFNGGGVNFGGGFVGGAPVAVARGSFKITENESPRPQDRVFASYNYYNNVRDVLDVHRETIGFEKTLLDGNASVELRLPFIQNRADGGATEADTADLTAIFKYAFINTPDAVLSAGLAVTAPTSSIPTVIIIRNTGIEEVHPTLLQPFVGYFWGPENWYVHGFTSVMVPTDSRDGTLLFNDVGVGYRYPVGPGLVREIIPTVEAHVTTPLSNRGIIGFSDSVDLTAGSYFLLGERLCLGTAVGTPVTGPRLFSFEALVNVNWSF